MFLFRLSLLIPESVIYLKSKKTKKSKKKVVIDAENGIDEDLKDLSIGTMELIKEFPDYEESLEKLKISLKEKQEEKPKN